jgi:hypothetical protein
MKTENSPAETAGTGTLKWRSACALAVVAAGLVACGGSATSDAKSGANAAKRNTRIPHEACNVDSAESLDANGDGKPDVRIVRDGGRERCRSVDLNFDGIVDTWIYRDGRGQVRRRETDFDRDGKIDEIAIYKAGVLVEKQSSTTLAQKLDTWQFYEGGARARIERDSDGDSVVDQWWEFKNPDCPLMHSDADGDGRPDPGATVDYCKETGYVPPDRGGPEPIGQRFERPDALPTEVDQKDEAEPAEPEKKGGSK